MNTRIVKSKRGRGRSVSASDKLNIKDKLRQTTEEKSIYCISVILIQLVHALNHIQRQPASFCSFSNPRKQICENRFCMRIGTNVMKTFAI